MVEYNWDECYIIIFFEENLVFIIKDLYVYYGEKEVIKGIDM